MFAKQNLKKALILTTYIYNLYICKVLKTELHQLSLLNSQYREENEELVVAIAVQHLRLLLARWRQPLLRERFRIQLQAAAEAILKEESGDGSPLESDNGRVLVTLDANGIAAARLIDSIKGEMEGANSEKVPFIATFDS